MIMSDLCLSVFVCVFSLSGGVSEEQRGSGAPLSLGVVMRRWGAVTGAVGGGFT